LSQFINVSELQRNLPGVGQLVDVRSASEFSAGHIPGAVNIPMDQIEGRLADLRPNVPVVLICQAGKRAHDGGIARAVPAGD
jgi:rhodanese-related sulfurtransferase